MPVLVALLVALVVFMIAAVAADWSDLGVTQIVFSALAGPSLYMLYGALHARSLLAHGSDRQQLGYMDDIGFVLIALFGGFVIATALDLGAPRGWWPPEPCLPSSLVTTASPLQTQR